MVRRVAIIGAGWAGLAAAIYLTQAGCVCTIFEASRQAGGRARSLTHREYTLDNGAHILIGAYHETLRLMQDIGIAPAWGLRRLPLHLETPGNFRLSAPRLPAPLHTAWALLAAQGLSWQEKWTTLRFMRALRSKSFRLAHDISVRQLLAGQPMAVCHFLWTPLCLSALNTPPEAASAQVFLNVLRDSLGAGRAASDLLLPTKPLGTLLPEPAISWLKMRGTHIHFQQRIKYIQRRDNCWQVGAHPEHYEAIILAVAPQHVPDLLPTAEPFASVCAPLRKQLAQLSFAPIATVYLAYPASIRLPSPMLGLSGVPGQWVFDRGNLYNEAGLLAVVISGDGPYRHMPHDVLAQAVHTQIAALMQRQGETVLPAPLWQKVVITHQATFLCTPNVSYPTVTTALPHLFLAGDYVATNPQDGVFANYPATLEAAVRSGKAAAREIILSA